jgi:hypothetical protein
MVAGFFLRLRGQIFSIFENIGIFCGNRKQKMVK